MNKKFIKASNKRCTFENHIAAPYIRKSFEIDFVPEKATISICGLGFYLLYINGKEITKGVLAPYISNPDHYCYYDTYDVSLYLKEGTNAIGIILGNGFLNPFGGSVWDFDKAEWIAPPCAALEFMAEARDCKIEFVADESFKVHTSPIVFDELRMGEYYDANKAIAGWNLPEFDDSSWENASLAQIPRGELRGCQVEPIVIRREVKSKSIQKTDEGYLFDFGENIAGVCKLEIEAERGQRIERSHCEILEDGKFSDKNIIFDRPTTQYYKEYNQKDVYIAKGDGIEVYVPHFTYHGFRYVHVIGVTEKQATENLLTCLVMHSDIKEIGHFECSDSVANILFDMVKRSDLSNFYYFPTDCPHREKNGWMGDTAVSAEHMTLLYDVEKSFREYLSNIRKSQNDYGALPGIVPTAGWGFAWGNGPAWDCALFNITYELYKKRGNLEVIKENAHAMLRYLEYIITRKNEDGTISVGLGDWVPVGRKNSDYKSPLALTDSIIVMDMAKKATEMFAAINQYHGKEFSKGIFKEMRQVIRENLIDFDTMVVKGNCQTSQAMCLYFDIFEEEEKEKAFLVLLDIIHKNNDSFDCGFLGLRVLFHVLSDFGESDLAYKMITKKEYPSYGHLIELGETTLPEQFMPDGVSCGSHNHHFFGDIANWFISRIAGLKIVTNEYVEIMPNFIDNMEYAYASYKLPSGTVSVKWLRNENEVELHINCPVKYSIKIHDCYKDLSIKLKK